MVNDGQVPVEAGEDAARNMNAFPGPRCSCVLLLDASRSMRLQNRFEHVLNGVKLLQEELLHDGLASKRVELQIVRFGTSLGNGVEIVNGFETVNQFVVPPLEVDPQGWTPIGEAVLTALEVLEKRKAAVHSLGIPYLRPWIFMITDGRPAGRLGTEDTSFDAAVEAVRDSETRKKVLFHSVMVDQDLSLEYLERLGTVNPPRILRPGMWSGMFVWLSNSMKRLSNSDPGREDSVPPVPDDDWAL